MKAMAENNIKWRMMIVLSIVSLFFTMSCDKHSVATENLSFAVKGLKCEVSEYGKRQFGGSEMKDVSYTHIGTIVSEGSAKPASGVFMVYYEVNRITGGDPNNPRRPGSFGMTIVKDGIGDLIINGGSQRVFNPPLFAEDEKPWDQEKIDVKIVGYSRIDQQDAPLKTESK